MDYDLCNASKDLSKDYVVYEIMSVCMCIKQQTDDLYA